MKASAKQMKYWAYQEAKLLKAQLKKDLFDRVLKTEGLTAACKIIAKR